MAAQDKDKKKPVNITIIKKGGHDDHDDHHGGAWKVAYADFVTAMMAFFLLLWILSAVQEEQLKGIADYFTPTLVPQASIGGNGLLDGSTIGPEGTLNSSTSPMTTVAVPDVGMDDPGTLPDIESENTETVVEYQEVTSSEQSGENKGQGPTTDPEEIEKILKEANDKSFSAVEAQILQAMQEVPDLTPLLPNIIFERTPEGLRIQIVDQENRSMFPLGSAQIADYTKDLLMLVGSAVAKLDNNIIITGHTDARPYRTDGAMTGYGNWELSADRANATRRVLLEAGVKDEKIVRVSGVAYRDPLNVDDPFAPENRRISIVLMYNNYGSSADVDRQLQEVNSVNEIIEMKPE